MKKVTLNSTFTSRRFLCTAVLLVMTSIVSSCASSDKRGEEPPEANPVGIPKSEPSTIGEEGEESGPSSNASPAVDASVPVNNRIDGRYRPLAQAVRAGRGQGIADETAKLLSANPHDPVALNTLALYQLRKGKTGAAKLLLNRAFEKNSPTASLHNNLGVTLLDEGDRAGAIINFKKALSLDPRHPEASANLGSIYVQGGDYSKGLALLQQAYRPLRSNSMVANNYAIALRANKDFEGARRVYEEILKANSRDVNATLNLAILLIDFLNKPKEGLDLVYKVKFLETDKKDVTDRANALEKKAKGELNL